jgi:hypothetical protein
VKGDIPKNPFTVKAAAGIVSLLPASISNFFLLNEIQRDIPV